MGTILIVSTTGNEFVNKLDVCVFIQCGCLSPDTDMEVCFRVLRKGTDLVVFVVILSFTPSLLEVMKQLQ